MIEPIIESYTNKYTSYLNNLKENKNINIPEQEQLIPKLYITKNGELLTYELDNMKLEKNIEDNMYSLHSMLTLLPESTMHQIRQFITTEKFYYILHSHDINFAIPEYVYLLILDDKFKIGRTFDIGKRYSPNYVSENLEYVVYVNNSSKCEVDLLVEMNKVFKLAKGREFFKLNKYEDKNKCKTIFNNIVNKYKPRNTEINNEKHLKYYRNDKHHGTGYYISDTVASILLNIFGKVDYKKCQNFFKVIELASAKIDKSDYISAFVENNERFFYWIYHGYTIIVNLDRNLINASRLWNTIIKQKEINKKRKTNYKFNRFLQLENIKETIKKRPETAPLKLTYKNKPLLNGKYMPIVFTHFILHHLDAEYAYDVAKQMTESIFEKEKAHAINSSNTLTGGYINNILRQLNEIILKGIDPRCPNLIIHQSKTYRKTRKNYHP